MASIYKRKLKSGGHSWRAIVRIQGHPTACESFSRKKEAEDWALEIERDIKLGKFKFERLKATHTFNDLFIHYINSGALEHHKSSKDTRRHLEWWNDRLGKYDLRYLHSELMISERQHLLNTPTEKGKARAPATVNRYFSTISSILGYASKLQWIDENPCIRLFKLKEPRGRDRILSSDEISRLLERCRQSKSPYLYCIFLIALTTGARKGEILNLKWDDIDFENKMASFRETKNGRPRGTYLVEPIMQELRRLYTIRQPHKLLVFASRTAFGEIDIKKAWQAALKQAGIGSFRFHDLRHTFATLASNSGASNIQLKACTGHRTLQMLERYTHPDGKTTQQHNQAVSNHIFGRTYE